MPPAAGLQFDLVLAQLEPDPIEAAVDDPVVLGEVGLRIFEGRDLARGHHRLQIRQRLWG
jgi:hypothetical protein